MYLILNHCWKSRPQDSEPREQFSLSSYISYSLFFVKKKPRELHIIDIKT